MRKILLLTVCLFVTLLSFGQCPVNNINLTTQADIDNFSANYPGCTDLPEAVLGNSSLVQADASNNSVVNKDSLKRYLNKSYQILELRLEQQQQCSGSDEQAKSGTANQKYISTTDPDASVTCRGKGKSTLKYQVHRSDLICRCSRSRAPYFC